MLDAYPHIAMMLVSFADGGACSKVRGYWSLKGLKLYALLCLSYSNNNTRQSSLLSPSLLFSRLCAF